MKKQPLRIIFLDFNGTIDTPYRYTAVTHDFSPRVGEKPPVMTEADYEALFKELVKTDAEMGIGDGDMEVVEGREPDETISGMGDDFDEKAWKAQEQMLLKLNPQNQVKPCITGDQEAIEERRAIIEESRGRRVGDPVADPDNWVEKEALKEEEIPGYIEVKDLKKEYDAEGYDQRGYDRDGYDRWGFDEDGIAVDGYDSEGYDKNGYNRYGFDRDGLDVEGFNSQGIKYTPCLPGIQSLRDNKAEPKNKWDEHRKPKKYYSEPLYRDEANPECVKYLKALIEETGAKIVYSTTRRYAGWESCARYVGLPPEYSLGGDAGITPINLPKEKLSPIDWFRRKFSFKKKTEPANYSWKPRQREIKTWLEKWQGEPIDSYVILDDDTITDPEMRKHWIPSVAENRFGKEEYEQALRILAKKA